MARRSNGEGTLRKRSDGRWESAIMDGYDVDGKPRRKYFSGKTRAEVKSKVEAWVIARSKGLDTNTDYTFRDWSAIWFERHRDSITPTTQESYKYTLRILNDFFGPRKIRDIKPYDVETFLKMLRAEGKSSTALAQCRGMLYQIFHKAEANDLVLKNPVAYADKLRNKEPKKRKECFTAAEVKLMMEKLPKDRIGMSIRLMLGTGMRSQELLALEPHHIAEDGSLIQIRQAINLVKGTAVVGRPKSQDSYRDVPVPPNLRECAIFLRKTPNAYIWEAGKPGCPCNPSHFRTQFKKALEGIEGVRVLTPHSCRHTYVSQMQALGVDIQTIQSIVGHADIDMTTHYLHVQDSIRQSAIEKFSEAFSV